MRVCRVQARVRILTCRKGTYQERKEDDVNRRIFKPWLAKKRGPIAVLAAAVAAAASLGAAGSGD